MIFTERVDVVHPASGAVLSAGERANVIATSTGIVVGENRSYVAVDRRLVMQLDRDTKWERGYRLRWLGELWEPDGDPLPIRRRGRTLYLQFPVKLRDTT